MSDTSQSRRPSPFEALGDARRVAAGAAGTLSGVRQQFRADIRDRMGELARIANLASRDDIADIEAVAARARQAQEDIMARLDALEARLDALEKPNARSGTTATKAAAKSPGKKASATKKTAAKAPASRAGRASSAKK